MLLSTLLAPASYLFARVFLGLPLSALGEHANQLYFADLSRATVAPVVMIWLLSRVGAFNWGARSLVQPAGYGSGVGWGGMEVKGSLGEPP